MPETFLHCSLIPASAEKVFQWHAAPNALALLSPPWEPVEILTPAPGIRNGGRGALRVRLGPLKLRWEFQHANFIENRQFQDIQTKGPFKSWTHTHTFTPAGPDSCWLEDRIEFELPLGILGKWIAAKMVRNKLEKLFAYRHRVTAEAMQVPVHLPLTSPPR